MPRKSSKAAPAPVPDPTPAAPPSLEPNTAALYERYYAAALNGLVSKYGVGKMPLSVMDQEADQVARFAISCQIARHRALAEELSDA